MRAAHQSLAVRIVVSLAILVILVAGQAQNTSDDHLSPAFSQAAMSALANIHLWKEKARNDARTGIPNAQYGPVLRTKAYGSVRQAQFVAKTTGDHSADVALEKHFSNVKAWVDGLVQARKNLNATQSLDPDSVDENPDLQKINECEKAFNAMLGVGTYADMAACQ
jgi:hypothetical protein